MSICKSIQLRYSEGETGWADDLGNGLARIKNVPMTDGLGIFDIVEIENVENSLPIINRVVNKHYERSIGIFYYQLKQFFVLKSVLGILNAFVGVIVAPTEDNPGIMMVNFNGDIDPILIAEGMGIPQPKKT